MEVQPLGDEGGAFEDGVGPARHSERRSMGAGFQAATNSLTYIRAFPVSASGEFVLAKRNILDQKARIKSWGAS